MIIDILVVGSGPAALGLMLNSIKTDRINDLLSGNGMAIISEEITFGGG